VFSDDHGITDDSYMSTSNSHSGRPPNDRLASASTDAARSRTVSQTATLHDNISPTVATSADVRNEQDIPSRQSVKSPVEAISPSNQDIIVVDWDGPNDPQNPRK
jgi:hypothetical protein